MYHYVQNLEKIITKDFYPDLPKLEAQAEYLDAVERKDTQKMWELQQKFSRKRTAFRTPGVCKKNLYDINVCVVLLSAQCIIGIGQIIKSICLYVSQ